MAVDMELEVYLRPPEFPQAPYPAKVITLANGKRMVVREARREEVPTLLKVVHPTLFIHKDYYDIVGARLYAELLGWYTYRVQNEYCLVGQVDGIIVGMKISWKYRPHKHSRPAWDLPVLHECIEGDVLPVEEYKGGFQPLV